MKAKNQNVIENLNKLLADYQIYYQNLRGLHWNVKGAMFFMLHEKFEEYYNEASEVVDEIVERILMIGGQPLHTFTEYLKQQPWLKFPTFPKEERQWKLSLKTTGFY
jgi:starvation-inducible DNA-binding protein